MSEFSGSAGPNFGLLGGIGQVGSNIGAGVSNIFAAEGDIAEAKNYDLAASLAGANVQFTQSMTAIREMQTQREVSGIIGKQQTGFAGGNIAESGSALDVLRSSVQQGSLQQYILAAQGAAQEAAYSEQQQAYTTMADAARNASIGSDIAAGIHGLTAIAGVAALI